jgi:hypothetical protein
LRCILHHPGDTNRELILTVLLFDVPNEQAGQDESA